MTNNKKIRIYSILWIVLALVSIFECASSFLTSNSNPLGEMDATTASILNVVAGISVVTVAIDVLVKLFFAYKGFQEIKEKNKGSGYITFAYVILVIDAINLASDVYSIITNKSLDLVSLCSAIVNTLILWDYAKTCNEIRSERQN